MRFNFQSKCINNDQYGNVNSIRGRSDVNQIVVVNPKSHHIVLK